LYKRHEIPDPQQVQISSAAIEMMEQGMDLKKLVEGFKADHKRIPATRGVITAM
jgi:hypothetical protein